MDSLTRLSRTFMAIWAVLILLCASAVWIATGGGSISRIPALLFTRPAAEPEMVPDVRPMPAPVIPEPAPVPTVRAPILPQTEWTVLPESREGGMGTVGKPEISVAADGSVTVLLPVKSGKPAGSHSFDPAAHPRSRSVDINGRWTGRAAVNTTLTQSVVSRVQIALHPQCLRVSATCGKGNAHPASTVEYSEQAGAIRVIFTPPVK